MKLRVGFAFGLAILAVPLVFIGLIDPLEGGVALLVAFLLGVAVRLLARVRVPRALWIPLTATAILGAVVLAIALLSSPENQTVSQDVTAANPLLPTAIILMWIYRVGVVATLVGTVIYVVRLGKALRAA